LDEFDKLETMGAVQAADWNQLTLIERQSTIYGSAVTREKENGDMKVRLVACDTSSNPVVPTNSQAVYFSSILLALTLGALAGSDIMTMDITKAFVHAERDPAESPVYVRLPKQVSKTLAEHRPHLRQFFDQDYGHLVLTVGKGHCTVSRRAQGTSSPWCRRS